MQQLRETEAQRDQMTSLSLITEGDGYYEGSGAHRTAFPMSCWCQQVLWSHWQLGMWQRLVDRVFIVSAR